MYKFHCVVTLLNKYTLLSSRGRQKCPTESLLTVFKDLICLKVKFSPSYTIKNNYLTNFSEIITGGGVVEDFVVCVSHIWKLIQYLAKSECAPQGLAKSECPLKGLAKSGCPFMGLSKSQCPLKESANSECPLKGLSKSECPPQGIGQL